MSTGRIRRTILEWYDRNARDLPWRRTRDPYAIWVAEVMLQQTRVETVLPYYARFLEKFPDVRALADAPLDDVLAAWSGLGYYRRARLLHRGAMHVKETHAARLPRTVDELRAIPGVGAYTTGAIASQAFDLEAPIVDGNVARLMARLFEIELDVKKGKGLAEAWRRSGELVKGERPGALNNALMELGATVCVPREPRCLICPVRSACAARAHGRERELPIASEKPVRPRVREIGAVLSHDDTLLLARCAPDGLFAGMWEPPRLAFADRHAARASLSSMLGVEVTLDDAPSHVVEHVLTHRVLEVTVFRGTLAKPPRGVAPSHRERYAEVAMIAPRELSSRGVSTLARRVLALTSKGGRRKRGSA